MEQYNHYEEAERLLQLLIKDDEKEQADFISDAMIGSTGTEINMALRWNINNILKLDSLSEETRNCAQRLWIELEKAYHMVD